MNYKSIAIIFFMVATLISCGNSDSKTEPQQALSNSHKVEVLEVLQTSSYTYLNVREKDNEYWLATNKREAEKGDILYYDQGLEMKDFPSKELQRTFPMLLMVQNISDQPIKSKMQMIPNDPKAAERISTEKQDVNVAVAPGGVTIAEIYKNQDSYSGKTVTIRGKVTKFNPNIMGKNWVHIQDGTGNEDGYDLTITTGDMVKVGEIVTFSGEITLNKDFGAGYSYKVLMEKASLKKES
jgi:hypothetical protein